MTIIADQPANAELTPAAAQAVVDLQAHSDAYARMAAFIQANPDLPGSLMIVAHAILVPLTSQPDAKAAVSAWMLRAVDAGALVKPFSDHTHAGVHLYFGPVYLQAYAEAKVMGERIEVKQTQWRLNIEIPEHARRADPETAA